MIGQRPPGNYHHKTRDCEPRGRAVLLGSLTLLLSARVPFPNKIACLVITCVSSDNSFPRVRQEPSFGPWKGSSFLQLCNPKHARLPTPTASQGKLIFAITPKRRGRRKKGIRCSETSISARDTATLTSVYSSCSLLDWQPCFRRRRRKGKLNLGVCLV